MLELLTKQQVAEKLKVSKGTIDYWVTSNQIPFRRLSPHKVRFDEDSIEAWLDKSQNVQALNKKN